MFFSELLEFDFSGDPNSCVSQPLITSCVIGYFGLQVLTPSLGVSGISQQEERHQPGLLCDPAPQGIIAVSVLDPCSHKGRNLQAGMCTFVAFSSSSKSLGRGRWAGGLEMFI